MGISTNYYTVYGIKYGYDDVPEDFMEHFDDIGYGKGMPTAIVDGMSGEYIIFGTILFDSGDLRYGDINDEYVEIDLNGLNAIKLKYQQEFLDKYPKWEHLVQKEFKLMTFAHYH